MKRTLLALSLAGCLVLSANAHSQVVGVDLSTGDIVLDQHLGYQDRLERDEFLRLLVNEFGGDRDYYLDLLQANSLSQSELYYACSVGAVSEVSCATVIDQRLDLRAKGQGWGVLAQSYGIKPGSARFLALKNRIGGKHHVEHSLGSDDGPWHDKAHKHGHKVEAKAHKKQWKKEGKPKKAKKNKDRDGRGD